MKPGIRPANDADEHEINLTPMLDVVFIMLVFFIVTSSFVRESGVAARTVRSEGNPSSEEEVILVRIDDSDTIWFGGLDVDVRAVRANIERLHALSPEFPVVIQPSRSSTTKRLVAVIDAARQTAVADIAIAPEGP